MKYETSEKEGIVVITIKEKMMDGPGLEKLHNKIKELVSVGARQMVIDLGEVPWIDSAGLGLLVTTFNNLKSIGGELKIADIKMYRTPGLIIEVDLRRFTWKTYDSAEKAVKSFPPIS